MSVYRILGGVYISSIEPINQGLDLKTQYGITHILSIIPGPIPQQYSSSSTYTWKQIEVTDEETTNLLPYFNDCYEFIESGLFKDSVDKKKHSACVLIHCSQGVSRSVAIVMAYLMKKYNLSLEQSLHAVKRKSPAVGPNAAFMEQLKLYKEMNCVVDENNEIYRQYLVELNLKIDPTGQSLRELMMQKAEIGKQQQEKSGEQQEKFDLRCKRCRQVVANNTHIEFHSIPESDSRQHQFIKTAPNSRRIISVQEGSSKCSHYFLKEPLVWMKEELDKAELEGRFQCPKCASKVGGYSWRGSRCSCGKWMVPAIHLQDAKVDLIKDVHAPIHSFQG
ncbi:YVH1 [[Candida] subhashii]|uniref:protein-tyrosine-phosphatase n=1 Tax=[Candida] subhashii TaxID=561895 RepID=A0A8J5QK76_9ASCO|nr:YVH1 [[Candida] subhashii]KAG7663489.1 YVH1 [[Candida] subhashii]